MKYNEKVEQETQKAIKRSFDNAETEWRDLTIKFLKKFCAKANEFTVNDIREKIRSFPVQPKDNRSMGGVIKYAESQGWIKRTGKYIFSVVGHRTTLQIWKSQINKK